MGAELTQQIDALLEGEIDSAVLAINCQQS